MADMFSQKRVVESPKELKADYRPGAERQGQHVESPKELKEVYDADTENEITGA